MAYTLEQIKGITLKMKQMPKIENKERKYNKKELVGLIKKDIEGMKKRGYSFAQISEFLNGEGVLMSASTLKSYINQSKIPKNENVKQPEKAGNKVESAVKNVSKTGSFTPNLDTQEI